MKNSVLIIFLLIIGYSYTQQTGTFTDSHDGKVYKNFVIGKQTWMSENLNVNHFRNGDQIPEAKTDEEWIKAGDNKQPAWCYYDNDPKNGETYGKLYNWYAVIDSRGLAPLGWRIPVKSDWSYLIDYLGGGGSSNVKLKSTSGWDLGAISKWFKNSNGTNESGFSGLPGGRCDNLGRFYGIGQDGYWWSSTEFNGSSTGVLWGAYCCDLTYYFEGIANILPGEKKNGCSIRFIKEINEVSNQVDTTGINIPITNLTNQETTKINTGSSPKCLSGDCNNGVGQWQYTDGSYSGEWKNSQRNGKGTFTGTNGDSYVGYYFEGTKHGKGKYEWKNGDTYDGDWVNNQRTGKGKYIFNEGTLYEGDFIDGKITGKGRMTWKNGEEYVGDWSNGEKTGNCKWTFPNGEIYEGAVANGKRHGKGTLLLSNGDIYIGEYLNGSRNGKGKCRWKNGDIYDGDWLNNQRTGKGRIFSNGDVYDGDFVNGEIIGFAKHFLSNGDKYEGAFLNGKYHGKGRYQWKNGNFCDGEWINGNRSGNGQINVIKNQTDNNYNQNSDLQYTNDYDKIIRNDTPPKWIEEIQDKVTKESVQLRRRENKKDRKMWPNFLQLGFYRYLDYIEDRSGLESKLYYGDIPYSGTYSYQNTAFNRIKTITNYKDGYRDGKEIIILNDSTTSESNYIEGRRFGLQIEYYENGKIHRYGNLINGNGILTEWDEDGKIASESIYKNGLLNGVCKRYVYSSTLDKKIISELNYKDGKLDGLAGSLNYSEGKLDGIQIFGHGENFFELQYSMDTLKSIIKIKKTINKYEPAERRIEQIFGLNNKNYLSGIESIFLKKDTVLYLQSQGVITRSNLNFSEEEVVDYINLCGANNNSDFILELVKKAWNGYIFCRISKDSVWKTWYFNGQLESIGNFTNNVQDGFWKAWFENGQLKTEGTYKLGIKEGNWKSWYSNGQLTSSGNYIAEQKNGSWKFYNEAGKLISDENYSNGKMNGLFTKYFDSGKLSSMKNYKNDIKDGNWKTYNEKGIVTEQEFYKNGKKDGIFITRHSNGVKSSEATYKDGAVIGEFKRFDEKGNLIIPQVIVNDNQNDNKNNNNNNNNNQNNYIKIESAEKPKEKCPSCYGSGLCFKCGKTQEAGYYDRSRNYIKIREIRYGMIICDMCHGEGEFMDSGECLHCNSRGWLFCNNCNSQGNGSWANGKNVGRCLRCKGTGLD
jgi:uncharacterized protein (TIGR02145 family)